MITIISAIGKNNELGKDNQLLWRLSADLKRFKETTLNNIIIMGRKTYESIEKPLPNRINVVITRDKEYVAKGCVVVNSLTEAIDFADGKDVFIIGGGEIYRQAISIADVLDITLVHGEFPDADTYFPKIDIMSYHEVYVETLYKDEKNEYDYTYITYIK